MPEPYVTAGSIWGSLTQEQKEEVLKEVRRQASARFQTYKKSIKEGAGLRTPKASARLDMYRARQPAVWQQLAAQFPEEYKRQMADWQRQERIAAAKPPTPPPPPDPNIVAAPGGEAFSLKELE